MNQLFHILMKQIQYFGFFDLHTPILFNNPNTKSLRSVNNIKHFIPLVIDTDVGTTVI